MRVGVDIGNVEQDPALGGQFTLMAAIVAELKKFIAGGRSPHVYTLLYTGSAEIADPEVQHVALDRMLPKWSRPMKLLGRVICKGTGGRIRLCEDPARKQKLEEAVRRFGLDLVWSIAPTVAIGAPFVSTVWDLDHRVTPFFPEVSVSGLTWDERETLYSTSLPKSAYVVTGTETGRKDIAWFYRLKESRIKVIPYPTPPFALAGAIAPDETIFKRLNIGSHEKYVFYPAQFWPHKNHVNLLSAILAIARSGRGDYKVVFTGADKGNLQFVKRFVEANGLQSRVCFAGFVSVGELMALYRGSRALVFLSYMGFDNLPPLEAMALGCPCVVSDIPGHRDQLGDAACFADPNNVEMIAQQILRVDLDQPFRDALIEKGRQRSSAWTACDYVASIDACVTEFAGYRANWPSGIAYVHP